MFKQENLKALKLLAANCPHNHICLENPDAVLCKIDYCVNEKVLFVKPQDESFCPYKNHFGHSHFCTCPVRLHLYLEKKV